MVIHVLNENATELCNRRFTVKENSEYRKLKKKTGERYVSYELVGAFRRTSSFCISDALRKTFKYKRFFSLEEASRINVENGVDLTVLDFKKSMVLVATSNPNDGL